MKQNNLALFDKVATTIQVVSKEKEPFFFSGSLVNLTWPTYPSHWRSLGKVRTTVNPVVRVACTYYKCRVQCACSNCKCSIQLFTVWDGIYVKISYLQRLFVIKYFFLIVFFGSKRRDFFTKLHFIYFFTKHYSKPTKREVIGIYSVWLHLLCN